MSKAVLVMDMPSSCKDCPLRVSLDNNFCIKTYLNITDKEYFDKKPNWCPLKPMPEKRETTDNFLEMCANIVRNSFIDELLKTE